MAWNAISRCGARYGWYRIALVAIVVLTVALRLRHAAIAMVYDEMASMYFSGQPLGHLWGWWMVRETNPPLFYTLLKLWRGVVPMGHWWMRALPLSIAAVHLVIFTRFLRARLGRSAALAGLLLFAVSWSDIYQAAYLRGYGLAKLAVLVSFIGLLHGLERQGAAARKGWAVYAAGAAVAIYCHTTMLLWPVVATIAVLADAAVTRRIRWPQLAALIAANAATGIASGWVLGMTWVQLHGHTTNIAWLEPLSWNDYLGKFNLQMFTGGLTSAILLVVMILLGIWRGWAQREVRLSTFVVIGTLLLFRAAEAVHPIVSDFTMHWCFSFTALLAGASLPRSWQAPAPRITAWIAAASLVGVVGFEVCSDQDNGEPQDWRYTVQTVANDPGAVLLASHESMGVVIEQACLVEFGQMPCPFKLVVMADPRPTDNWSFGGYHGRLVAPDDVRAALGSASKVYVFSRYYYTPLEHLGMNPKYWFQAMWDDGELIGPMPVSAFDPKRGRVPDYDAQYMGVP